MRCLVIFLKWTKISIEDKRFRLSLRGYMPSLPQRRHIYFRKDKEYFF